MKTMTGAAIAPNDLDLLSLPARQLVFLYVDEIFSDYVDRAATLPEVVNEIKAIIETLLPPDARLRA
jgi:hypothetical protein